MIDPRLKRIIVLTVFFLIIGMSAFSQKVSNDSISWKNSIYVGGSLSTTGIGLEVYKRLNNKFEVRLSSSYFPYRYNLHKLSPDLTGTAKIRFGMEGVYVNYYLKPYLFLSTGMSLNLLKVSVQGQLAEAIEIGDIVLEPDEVGELKLDIVPSWLLNPYIGGGVILRRDKPFFIGIETGIYFQGKPDVTLNATGMLTPTASKEQELLMEKNIAPIDFWPLLSVHFNYRLN